MLKFLASRLTPLIKIAFRFNQYGSLANLPVYSCYIYLTLLTQLSGMDWGSKIMVYPVDFMKK
jgi:hypothetical protein